MCIHIIIFQYSFSFKYSFLFYTNGVLYSSTRAFRTECTGATRTHVRTHARTHTHTAHSTQNTPTTYKLTFHWCNAGADNHVAMLRVLSCLFPPAKPLVLQARTHATNQLTRTRPNFFFSFFLSFYFLFLSFLFIPFSFSVKRGCKIRREKATVARQGLLIGNARAAKDGCGSGIGGV